MAVTPVAAAAGLGRCATCVHSHEEEGEPQMLFHARSRLSRRDFLRYCAATAAVLGLSQTAVPRIAAALEEAAQKRLPVVWLGGQGCHGCAVSLLNSDEPTPAQLILETLSLRYFPLVAAGSGDLVLGTLAETMRTDAGKYLLLVEGSIPLGAQGAYATMGFEQGKPVTIESWLKRLAKSAKATLAVGTCAAYGGIPVLFAGAEARSVEAVLQQPVPAIAGCPPHPDWIVGTLVKLLLFGKDALLDALDSERRPREFYRGLVHDNCPRRASFDAGIFVDAFNDSLRVDSGCLLTKGCKGPVTHADCPERRWNQRMNWCIGAGAPCNGCTEPAFYEGMSPLFESVPSVKLPGTRPLGVSADVLGAVMGAGTAVGIGAHLVAQMARGRIGASKAVPETEAPPEPALKPAPPEPGPASTPPVTPAASSIPQPGGHEQAESEKAAPPKEQGVASGYYGPGREPRQGSDAGSGQDARQPGVHQGGMGSETASQEDEK